MQLTHEWMPLPTYLLPNRSFAAELLARLLLRFGLVDFDHAAVELCLVHVVDGFEGVFGEGEFDVAEASVRVLGGFSFWKWNQYASG